MKRASPQVLLFVETSMAFGRGVLEGISRYLMETQPWQVHLEPRDLIAAPPAWLSEWTGDGIISRSSTPELASILLQRQIPTVDLTDMYGDQGLPSIWNDHAAIGEMAAEHLIDRGFETLAFCGFEDQWWSSRRGAGFQAYAAMRGMEAEVWGSSWKQALQLGWQTQQIDLIAWLQQLPKPVGIMACNDLRGQHVLEACRQADIAVPEEVAVVGVDNDPVICDYCGPPLSSVIPDARRVGYEAARMLDSIMAGNCPTHRVTMIPPLDIAVRQSSDVLAVDDPDIAAAMRFIREHACQGMTIDDLLKAIPLSRSQLERKFRKHFGRSPQVEVRLVQLKRARQLLAQTDLSLDQVASRVGFAHSEYFSVVFKRHLGETPGQYRRRMQ